MRDGREEEGLQAAVAAEEGVGSRPRWDGRARPWRRHAMMQVTIASVIQVASKDDVGALLEEARMRSDVVGYLLGVIESRSARPPSSPSDPTPSASLLSSSRFCFLALPPFYSSSLFQRSPEPSRHGHHTPRGCPRSHAHSSARSRQHHLGGRFLDPWPEVDSFGNLLSSTQQLVAPRGRNVAEPRSERSLKQTTGEASDDGCEWWSGASELAGRGRRRGHNEEQRARLR